MVEVSSLRKGKMFWLGLDATDPKLWKTMKPLTFLSWEHFQNLSSPQIAILGLGPRLNFSLKQSLLTAQSLQRVGDGGLLQKPEVDWATWASLLAQMVKRLPAVQETWVQSLGQEDALEKAMATHSSTLVWKIPWMEEPGRLQSMESQRVTHDEWPHFLLWAVWKLGHYTQPEEWPFFGNTWYRRMPSTISGSWKSSQTWWFYVDVVLNGSPLGGCSTPHRTIETYSKGKREIGGRSAY